MNDFLTSNEWQWRLLRTIAQGVLGVVVANIDLLVGVAVLEPTWRALVVALVMAVLSPLMAEIGKGNGLKGAAMSKFELTEEQIAAIEARQAEGCPDDWAPEPEEVEQDG